MIFNYKAGLFRIWLVLSLFWVVAILWAGLPLSAAIGVPIGFGLVLCLLVWAIRGFGVKERPAGQTFDLSELRRDLSGSKAEYSELYNTELEAFLNQLEAKHGNNVPIAEMEGLQNLVRTKLIDIVQRKQQIIDQEAKEGKAIEIDALRRRMEATKVAYTGPDRDAYASELDSLLDSLTAKYGSRIPVDEAYKVMQDLEADRG